MKRHICIAVISTLPFMGGLLLLPQRGVCFNPPQQSKPAGGTLSVLDDKRRAAALALEGARQLRSEGTAASLKSAIEKYQHARELWHEVGDQPAEATTLNDIGQVYNSLGEGQKALDFYDQALPLERAVGDHSGEAATLNNIGMVYDLLWEKQKALDYYNKALPARGWRPLHGSRNAQQCRWGL